MLCLQGLLDQAASSGTARKPVLDALARALESRDTYYRVRQDAAVALAAMRDAEGNTPGTHSLTLAGGWVGAVCAVQPREGC